MPDGQIHSVLFICHDHACQGHFSKRKTTTKILQSRVNWPTLFNDTHELQRYIHCQQLGKISRKDMMLLNPIIVFNIFDVQENDFMGPFPNPFGKEYVLVYVNCVSKWGDAIPIRTNEPKVVIRFLWENIFACYGMPQVIIN